MGGELIEVVYLDLLFLVNLIANYLLLTLTARMGGKEIRKLSCVLSAGFGASYAAAQVCGVEFLTHPFCKIGAGILMPLIVFGKERGLFKSICLFFASSAALGGAVYAVEALAGDHSAAEHGGLYLSTDFRVLLVVLLLCCGAITAVTDRVFTHTAGELLTVHITARGQTICLTALLDTGNTLTELGNNRPVLVAEGEACRSLLPTKLPLERPVEAMEILDEKSVKGFSLLPYRAVGVSDGILLAMRVEQVRIGKKEQKNMLVALSPTPVSDGGGYHALIGGEGWS